MKVDTEGMIKAFFRGEPLNSRVWSLASRNERHPSIVDVNSISILRRESPQTDTRTHRRSQDFLWSALTTHPYKLRRKLLFLALGVHLHPLHPWLRLWTDGQAGLYCNSAVMR